MKLETRYSNHPNDVKHYTTEELREHFLIEKVFVADPVNLFSQRSYHCWWDHAC